MLADGGTIVLNEIGDLPPDMQLTLLRALREREFERLGSTRPIKVDVRVIAATNRDLKAAMATGGMPDSRLVVATLSSRAPVTSRILPGPILSLASAPPLAGFVPAAYLPASRTGAFSGTADVIYTPGTPWQMTVTYTDYSDDGYAFLDGTESVVYTPGLDR